MKNYLIILFLTTSLYSYDKDVTVTANKIELTDNFISVKDSKKKDEKTVHEKLIKDISYISTKDSHNKNSISFRGIKSSGTNIIENLIPVYKRTDGNTDFYYNYNMYNMSSNMLVIPSSLGVSSMGSDIELFSKLPNKKFEGEISTTVSQYDNQEKLYLGSLDKNFFLQLYTSRFDRDDYKLSNDFKPTSEQPSRKRDNSDESYKNYELKTGLFLNDNDSVMIKLKKSESKFGIPQNVYDNSDGYRRFTKKELNSIYGYYDHLEDNFETNLRVFYDDYNDIFDFYTNNSYTTLLFPSSLFDDERVGVIGKIKLKDEKNSLSFVTMLQRDEHVWIRDGSDYQPKFQYQKINSSIIGKNLIDNFTINSAITFKNFITIKTDYDNDPTFTKSSNNLEKNILDYQIGIDYLFDSNLLYISHSKTSRIPSMNEIFTFFPWDIKNLDLKHESSKNIEIGYKRFLKSGIYSLSLFFYDIKDKIVYVNNQYENSDKTIHKGGEFRYENRYFHKHDFNFSYSYLHAKDKDKNSLEFIPRNKLVIEDTIKINKKYSTNIQYIYIDKRADNTNNGTKNLSSYSLTNIYLNYWASSDIDITIGVKNLFDKNYELAYGYPSMGRNIYGNLSWKF